MAIVVECVILKVKSLQILSLIWPWEIIIKFITLLENRSSVVTTVRSSFPLDLFHACEERINVKLGVSKASLFPRRTFVPIPGCSPFIALRRVGSNTNSLGIYFLVCIGFRGSLTLTRVCLLASEEMWHPRRLREQKSKVLVKWKAIKGQPIVVALLASREEETRVKK